MAFETIEDFKINQYEYAFLLENTSKDSEKLPMTISKLMPLIKRAKENATLSFNPNIFINAKDCKPIVSQTIKTQTYLSIPRVLNANFTKKSDDSGIIHKDVQFVCLIMNENIRDIYLTDFV